MLKSDHDKVKGMMADYRTMSYDEKKIQAENIASELAVHMDLEESVFYPSLKESSPEAEDAVQESLDDHEEVKGHIAGIYRAADEEELDMHMEDMEEAVLDHVEEEEREVFALAEKGMGEKFASLAAEMGAYKAKAKGQALIDRIKASF